MCSNAGRGGLRGGAEEAAKQPGFVKSLNFSKGLHAEGVGAQDSFLPDPLGGPEKRTSVFVPHGASKPSEPHPFRKEEEEEEGNQTSGGRSTHARTSKLSADWPACGSKAPMALSESYSPTIYGQFFGSKRTSKVSICLAGSEKE